LPAWTEKRDGDVIRHLRGIHDAELRELENDTPHPGAMPQSLARYMLGRINEQRVKSVAENWPDWFGDLAQFLFAVEQVRQEEVNQGRTELRAYIARSSEEAEWPYHFKAIAENWLEAIESWQAFKAEKETEPGDRALRALRSYRRTAPAMLHRVIDLEIAQTQDRIREAKRAEEEAERAAQAALVEEDLAKIETARAELYPLVQSRDFRRAMPRARQLASPLQTDEGRAALELLLNSYERMESLKRFIISGIDRNPVPQSIAPELGGDALGASLAGIRVSLGGYGTMVRAWDQISERLIATLAEYYIAQLPADERADMTLSLAVFAYQSRGMRPAQMYAERAMELDGSLRQEARALMPDLELD